MTNPISDFEGISCPLPLSHKDRIVMGHGSGGKMSYELISKIFFPPFDNPILKTGDDAALITLPVKRGEPYSKLAISTDSHVVMPLFFPGGDIGRLAICGTVNDLCMVGATPLYLTVGFILEEGLDIETLNKVIGSMRIAATEAQIQIIAGDTKVVQNGKADGMYINTTGVGIVPNGLNISGTMAKPGDVVIVSGSMGDHGIAVLAARGDLKFEAQLKSDISPLNGLVATMLNATNGIHVLRDPTRGGLATSLNEIAIQSRVGIMIYEEKIPIKPEVEAACEMLGFDPLYIANEGKLIVIVDENYAERLLSVMQKHPLGVDSQIIGIVTERQEPHVILKTAFGTTRMIDMMSGEMLPRIC